MSRKQALAGFQSELHISHSQIFMYLTCPLKYKFQYVEQRPQEHIPIALPFGKAVHSAIERYYIALRDTDVALPLEEIQKEFQGHLRRDLDATEIPTLYKKEAPDRESVIKMGNGLLKAFYDGIDLTGFQIAGVELPLSARLFNEKGEPLDMVLTGIIDLLLKDEQGNIIAVDNKTAKQPYSQATVDEDLQLTSYAYLLASNKFVFPTADVYCRFDVMRKLKTPKFEQYYTVRNASQRRRFARLVTQILTAMDHKIFFPNTSWMCRDCQFVTACKKW